MRRGLDGGGRIDPYSIGGDMAAATGDAAEQERWIRDGEHGLGVGDGGSGGLGRRRGRGASLSGSMRTPEAVDQLGSRD